MELVTSPQITRALEIYFLPFLYGPGNSYNTHKWNLITISKTNISKKSKN